MRIGDLVKMDFEDFGNLKGDQWGVGVIVEISDRTPDDVCVFWSGHQQESWEMKALLEKIGDDDEST